MKTKLTVLWTVIFLFIGSLLYAATLPTAAPVHSGMGQADKLGYIADYTQRLVTGSGVATLPAAAPTHKGMGQGELLGYIADNLQDLLNGGGLGGTVTVRAASTTNVTIATALNNGDTLDTLTLATDDRVLLTGQTDAEDNGIWVVGATPVRAGDADAWEDFPGMFVVVEAGSVNIGKVFAFVGAETGTLDTDDITYEEKAGEGLAASNNLSDVASAATAFANIKQAASDTATGVVELATTAEAVTGSDTARAVTPAGLTSRMAAPGAIGGTTPAAGSFTTGNFSGALSAASYNGVTISSTGGGIALDSTLTITSGFDFTIINPAAVAMTTPATNFTAARIDAAQTFSGTQTFGGTVLNLGGGATALELRFLEPSGGGAHYFSLKAPALAGNVQLLLPIDAPGAGEVLGDSDADGELEWITPAGSGDVTQSGDNVFTGENDFTASSVLLGDVTMDNLTISGLTIGATPVTATGPELNYVDGVTSAIQTQLDAKAPLASPTLTGTPAAPTAAAGTDTTQIATTAYVQDEVDNTQTGSHTTPSTSNPLAPTWTGPGHTVWYGATGEIDLPAAAGYTGRVLMVFNTGAFTITLDPNASEVIVREGTVQTGGVTMTLSSGAGNYVALLCDGVRWVTFGYKGTLAAGS